MKRKRLAVVGVLAVIALVAVFFPKRSSTRLEKTRAALRARGEKLTAAEFLPKPQPPTVTLDALTNLVKQLQVTAVDPSLLAQMEMISAGKARCAWRAEDVSGHSWQDFDAQLGAAQQTLSEIRALFAARPRHLGWDYKNWSAEPNGHFIDRRTAVQWLGGEVVNDLHHQRNAKAVKNLRSLVDAVHTYDEHWTFVNQMIRFAMAGFVLRTTWEALQVPDWTEAQLLELQNDWSAVRMIDTMGRTFEGERVVALEAFQQTRAQHTNSVLNEFGPNLSGSNKVARAIEKKVYPSIWRTLWSAGDEALYLDWSQSHLDAIRRAMQRNNWQELDRELRAIQQRQPQITTLNDARFAVSEAIKPNTWKGLQRAMEIETFRQMVVAAIAIKRFELSNHRPPESLAALVPQFLARLPIDYMDGKPLRYRVESDASWILYSVGLNGSDDGGLPATVDPEATNSNANSKEFWSTPDVLWPRAEPAESNRPASHPR